MTKLPYTISAGYADEWIIGFQSADYIKMDDEERAAYKQQLAQAMSVRYNTLRGMDTERLAESLPVRSLLHDTAFLLQDYLDAEGSVQIDWDNQAELLVAVLHYILGVHDNQTCIEDWEKFKETLNNDRDE